MRITIAIDGHSSCGKSTLARALAAHLNYIYVDSGAMYRAVTLHFLRGDLHLDDDQAVATELGRIDLDFVAEEGRQFVRLNGEILTEELRTMAVNSLVSPVATLSAVRTFLVEKQQALGERGGIVMDGRDIGTVVFPSAELKLFVTASEAVRVVRRHAELLGLGKTVTPEAVKRNLLERDRIDSTREDSPLRQASDAVLVDNTNLTRDEQLAMVLAIARLRA